MSIEKQFNGKFRSAMNEFLNKQDRASKNRHIQPIPAKRRR